MKTCRMDRRRIKAVILFPCSLVHPLPGVFDEDTDDDTAARTRLHDVFSPEVDS